MSRPGFLPYVIYQSVVKVISDWICVKSVIQVVFNIQGVSLSNLLLDVVHVEWSILGRISRRVATS